MKVFMYDDTPNFGDVLNEYLWPKYFGEFINRPDNILMMGIGTVLGSRFQHDGQVIVCGSGTGYVSLDETNFSDWKIFFVRGPQTAKALNLSEDMFITDPAILTPDVFPQAQKHDQVVFVPHWETSLNPLWKSACEEAGVTYVNPLDDIKKVIDQISGAKLVIAEAMHATIIADAYRVPWVPVSSSKRINEFKWQDWAASLGQVIKFNYLPELGLSGKLFNMAGQKNLGSISSITPRKTALSHIKRIYRILFPDKWQRQKHFKLAWKISQKIDGVRSTFLGTSAEVVLALRNLAQLSGNLSDAEISKTKKEQMLKKFEEISSYLREYGR